MSRVIQNDNSMPARVQKVLAHMGLGSRRGIESWIKAGRISINGRLAQCGDLICSGDQVRIGGKLVDISVAGGFAPRVIAYHKPVGEMCTRKDPQGRPTVFSSLPRLRRARWISIGRLDFTTTGLLLFTNDGRLAHRLMHPSSVIEREYAVRVIGRPSATQLGEMRRGVALEDGTAGFCNIADAGGQGVNHWYHVTLTRGRNHEVKRIWESQGISVSRLTRIRFGSVKLPRSLKPGRFMELDHGEIRVLIAGLPGPHKLGPVPKDRAASKGRRRRSVAVPARQI